VAVVSLKKKLPLEKICETIRGNVLAMVPE